MALTTFKLEREVTMYRNKIDLNKIFSQLLFKPLTGADPGFQVRGAHLKKYRREGG
jgi:hypothetical protein